MELSTPPESFLESLERYLEGDEDTPSAEVKEAIDEAKRYACACVCVWACACVFVYVRACVRACVKQRRATERLKWERHIRGVRVSWT